MVTPKTPWYCLRGWRDTLGRSSSKKGIAPRAGGNCFKVLARLPAGRRAYRPEFMGCYSLKGYLLGKISGQSFLLVNFLEAIDLGLGVAVLKHDALVSILVLFGLHLFYLN